MEINKLGTNNSYTPNVNNDSNIKSTPISNKITQPVETTSMTSPGGVMGGEAFAALAPPAKSIVLQDITVANSNFKISGDIPSKSISGNPNNSIYVTGSYTVREMIPRSEAGFIESLLEMSSIISSVSSSSSNLVYVSTEKVKTTSAAAILHLDITNEQMNEYNGNIDFSLYCSENNPNRTSNIRAELKYADKVLDSFSINKNDKEHHSIKLSSDFSKIKELYGNIDLRALHVELSAETTNSGFLSFNNAQVKLTELPQYEAQANQIQSSIAKSSGSGVTHTPFPTDPNTSEAAKTLLNGLTDDDLRKLSEAITSSLESHYTNSANKEDSSLIKKALDEFFKVTSYAKAGVDYCELQGIDLKTLVKDSFSKDINTLLSVTLKKEVKNIGNAIKNSFCNNLVSKKDIDSLFRQLNKSINAIPHDKLLKLTRNMENLTSKSIAALGPIGIISDLNTIANDESDFKQTLSMISLASNIGGPFLSVPVGLATFGLSLYYDHLDKSTQNELDKAFSVSDTPNVIFTNHNLYDVFPESSPFRSTGNTEVDNIIQSVGNLLGSQSIQIPKELKELFKQNCKTAMTAIDEPIVASGGSYTAPEYMAVANATAPTNTNSSEERREHRFKDERLVDINDVWTKDPSKNHLNPYSNLA